MTKQSGAGRKKADMRLDGTIMLEHKDCAGASISLKEAWVTKLIKEAHNEEKIPVLAITFGSGLEVYCLTRVEFERYRKAIGAQNG